MKTTDISTQTHGSASVSPDEKIGILLAAGILLITAIIFWPLIYATVISVSLAIVLIPFKRRFAERIGSGYAAAMTCFLTLSGIILFLVVLINAILINRDYIITIAGTIANSLRNYNTESLSSLSGSKGMIAQYLSPEWLAKLIDQTAPIIIQSATQTAQSIPGLFIQILIIILMLFLLLRNGEQIAARCTAALPPRILRYLMTLWKVTSDTMYGVYVVNVGVAVMTFFITVPFFWLLGYGEPFFWAFICAACQLFPFFGPQLITIFFALYAIANGDMRALLLTCCLGYPLISGVQDFFIRPRLLAERIAIHPALMMIAIFGGMLILGPIGLIIGPLVVALADSAYTILIDILEERQIADLNDPSSDLCQRITSLGKSQGEGHDGEKN
ncbi:MAG TPA: AI-2E family transporter [Methanospirillum sp.]|nr:AI-2E family transporter [Methanospirillum sp.]